MAGSVAPRMDLKTFGVELRRVTGGRTPRTAAEQEDAVLSVLTTKTGEAIVLRVDKGPLDPWPKMGWPGYALDELVRSGIISFMDGPTCRCWKIADYRR